MSEKSQAQFDESWHLPGKFRADAETAQGQRVIASSDESQRELRETENIAQALAQNENSPQHRARKRADLTRTHIESLGDVKTLSPTHKRVYAAACAELGDYNTAAALEPDLHQRIVYDEILLAVHRDDTDWCNHPKHHQFVERDIFSEKHRSDAHLLKCNIPDCDFRNAVADLPETIQTQRKKRQASIEKFSGMKPLEAKDLAK